MGNKHKVTVLPSDRVVEIDGDVNLLEALKEEGIHLKSSCGGHASCSDCIVKIKFGEDHLEPPTFEEIKFLGNVFHITKERLACQTKINGNVTIDITGHEESVDEKKIKSRNAKHLKKKTTKVLKKDEARFSSRELEESEDQAKKEDEGRDGGFKKPRLFISDEEVRAKLNLDKPRKKKERS